MHQSQGLTAKCTRDGIRKLEHNWVVVPRIIPYYSYVEKGTNIKIFFVAKWLSHNFSKSKGSATNFAMPVACQHAVGMFGGVAGISWAGQNPPTTHWKCNSKMNFLKSVAGSKVF